MNTIGFDTDRSNRREGRNRAVNEIQILLSLGLEK